MHAPVDAGRLAHTKLGLLVHGNALAKALISHPAKPLAVACVSADGRMSSWASAEWHSLVEHVGHRLKLILLRRLHLQQSRSARPSAIKKSSVAVQFVRRAAFSSHKWQVKSSQVKRRIFVTVNKLGRQHRHVPSSYPLHYNTHYRTLALAARSVTETLNNLSMHHGALRAAAARSLIISKHARDPFLGIPRPPNGMIP